MPLLEGRMILQTVLVFAMIGLLALVLRWTFKRDKDSPDWPDPGTPWSVPEMSGRALPPMAMPLADPEFAQPVTLDEDRDDYGLLAEAARVDSADEADRIRALLAQAGIRATSTVGRDGRHKVLVFTTEVHRARRVAGGSSTP